MRSSLGIYIYDDVTSKLSHRHHKSHTAPTSGSYASPLTVNAATIILHGRAYGIGCRNLHHVVVLQAAELLGSVEPPLQRFLWLKMVYISSKGTSSPR